MIKNKMKSSARKSEISTDRIPKINMVLYILEREYSSSKVVMIPNLPQFLFHTVDGVSF